LNNPYDEELQSVTLPFGSLLRVPSAALLNSAFLKC